MRWIGFRPVRWTRRFRPLVLKKKHHDQCRFPCSAGSASNHRIAVAHSSRVRRAILGFSLLELLLDNLDKPVNSGGFLGNMTRFAERFHPRFVSAACGSFSASPTRPRSGIGATGLARSVAADFASARSRRASSFGACARIEGLRRSRNPDRHARRTHRCTYRVRPRR
jgi:hypothetical protein